MDGDLEGHKLIGSVVVCLLGWALPIKKDQKSPYKRNAFGNHSKGIINLNLKLNYEKLFAFLGLYFDSAGRKL